MDYNIKWDKRFLTLAKEVQSWSKDKSTRVGCVIADGKYLRSVGFNGIPAGLNDDVPERHERPVKYHWIDHAEVNALEAFPYNDAKGCTAYVTHFPCAACARALIRKKISRIVTIEREDTTSFDERWQVEQKAALEMLKESGIIIHSLKESQL